MPFVIGLFVGLLYLVRWNGIFIAAAITLTEYNPLIKRANWKTFAVFCAGVLLPASPILVRNMLFQGAALSAINSAGFWAGGKSLPGYYYFTQLETFSSWEFVKTHPEEIFENIFDKIFILINDFPREFGIVLLLLMAAGLFLSLKDRPQFRMQRFIVFTFFIQTFFIILTNAEARYYGFFVPALVLFVYVYLKNFENRFVEAAVYVIVTAVVVYSSISFWKEGKPLNYYQILGKAVEAKTSKNDIIISDLAWAMSWYGDRKAIWLTYDLDTMDKIANRIPINYALISFETVVRPLVLYKDRVWQKLMQNPGSYNVPGFKMVEIYYVDKQPIAVLYKVERGKLI